MQNFFKKVLTESFYFCKALAIHVSESTKQLLDRFQSFKLQLRGEVPMKGKGTLVTYWLTEEVVYEEPSIEECESLV